jgi:hypothetical protein
VSAETLYEAVALGMAAIRADEWIAGIATGLNTVKNPALEERQGRGTRQTRFSNSILI